ncbi:MAG TPA: YIP1 family protein [archaeon]|nr:YIP1 family protein [archaeon]
MVNLLNPVDGFKSKQKGLGKSVTMLLVAAVIFTVAVAISWWAVNAASTTAGLGALAVLKGGQPVNLLVGVFLSVFLGGLFLGWLLTEVMRVLGGKGTLNQGVTVLAYSALPLSVGTLLAVLVSHIPYAFIGTGSAVFTLMQVIALVLFSAFGALGFAGVYRGTKDLYGVDAVTAFVGLGLLVALFGAALTIIPAGSALLTPLAKAVPFLPGAGLTPLAVPA